MEGSRHQGGGLRGCIVPRSLMGNWTNLNTKTGEPDLAQKSPNRSTRLNKKLTGQIQGASQFVKDLLLHPHAARDPEESAHRRRLHVLHEVAERLLPARAHVGGAGVEPRPRLEDLVALRTVRGVVDHLSDYVLALFAQLPEPSGVVVRRGLRPLAPPAERPVVQQRLEQPLRVLLAHPVVPLDGRHGLAPLGAEPGEVRPLRLRQRAPVAVDEPLEHVRRVAVDDIGVLVARPVIQAAQGVARDERERRVRKLVHPPHPVRGESVGEDEHAARRGQAVEESE
eukprot:gene10824-biopygen11531